MLCAAPSHADKAPARRRDGPVTLAEAEQYDEIIDVRSPAEFAEDHIPGAINLPVLDNEERARVGTLYKQVAAFDAKKLGAALVSRNIAQHLERHFADKPRNYRPLVYCWRGGSRSGAMATVLRSVGWHAGQLEGGYKAYRRAVVADLAAWPEPLRFIVVCGATGVGKSRFLRALAEAGAQVLDLEDLAAHKGSVLGAEPDRPQPPQKFFESLIWQHLKGLDRNQPVYVESESKKIGNLHTPEALLARMRASPCLNLEAAVPVRVALLLDEYGHFLRQPELLFRQLDCLVALLGRDRIDAWKALARDGDWNQLVAELLERHYDPAYARSLGRNYTLAADGPRLYLDSPEPAAFAALARQVMASARSA
jgi:tRNA 2-selenouridine synthase